MQLSTIIALVFIGLAAGVLSGFVGIGGGLLIVPCLVYFLGMSQHEAQGTSLVMMLPPIGILACYNYYQAGSLNWKYGMILASVFVVGAFFGSKFSLKLSPQTVKRVFGVILFFASIKMIFSK
jgi:uncharacterized membrane protein YfcA